ncbi:MAG: 1-(5-phosphoribosyl)-5-[(5-phosphoribosylamino)methylideneamino]imidazole-4-carboxamide isomerase [Chloroflexi bacterium]|nr:1-(5-phosphoribosyl)-5-[(5-phosphoribosylamino)methylideneamino]imidazole-4-carboxamide isomerase [Chloroflexota bacterium]
MEVIPAIDLRRGRVVRLYQGDFRRQTVYAQDPVEVALRWQEQGAPRLHVVDLDGARSGQPANLEALKALARRVSIPLQVGGGVRSLEAARKLVALGAERVVLGTSAATDPGVVEAICQALGREAVIVGIDTREGRVAVKGWSQTLPVTAEELMKRMVGLGVGRFVCTDIRADGTLAGPDFPAVAALVKAVDVPVIASGGIRSLDDLDRLAAIGVEGAVVGKALYEGTVELREAVARFAPPKPAPPATRWAARPG